MDIVLNRNGGVPVKDQLCLQLELKILSGDLKAGERLPSVRALARRLKIHPNTISAAYKDLEATGHVGLQRGAGVFVRPGAPSALEDARGLDEMIRLALYAAFRRGYSGVEIRTAVHRWLDAAPPDRIVVIDPSVEMGELLVDEIRAALSVPATSCTLADAEKEPALLSGSLVLTLPYHAGNLARLNPAVTVEALALELAEADREVVRKLPEGAIVLVVSHSPRVLPFASVILKSLRGDEILVETRSLAAAKEWRRLIPAADLVFADTLAAPVVRRARPRKLRELRFVSSETLARLKGALRMAAPRT